MQVILLERIAKLGQMGDVVDVKPGYARNFLLPQGKAKSASEANIAAFESEKARSEEPRLNSSHTVTSYAVFCLKKKKKYSSMSFVRHLHQTLCDIRMNPSCLRERTISNISSYYKISQDRQ